MNISALSKPNQSLLALILMLCGTVAVAEDSVDQNGQLVSKINYHFVGHLGHTDDQGRQLVWEGTIEGDLNGDIKWWFVSPPAIPEFEFMGGRISFYAAKWEIWKDGELVLAGNSAGKTVFHDGADGIWDGNGFVTETDTESGPLKGRKVYETGPVVIGLDPPVSFSGTGLFQIF